MYLTPEQDRVMWVLKSEGMIAFSSITSILQLNALRDLCKKGVARFARFSANNCGYVLKNHSFLDDTSETP